MDLKEAQRRLDQAKPTEAACEMDCDAAVSNLLRHLLRLQSSGDAFGLSNGHVSSSIGRSSNAKSLVSSIHPERP